MDRVSLAKDIVEHGINLAASPIHSDVEIDRTIAELGSAQGGGLVVLPDPGHEHTQRPYH
jgi:hypothetical protein